jgi:hypothetical protein
MLLENYIGSALLFNVVKNSIGILLGLKINQGRYRIRNGALRGIHGALRSIHGVLRGIHGVLRDIHVALHGIHGVLSGIHGDYQVFMRYSWSINNSMNNQESTKHKPPPPCQDLHHPQLYDHNWSFETTKAALRSISS